MDGVGQSQATCREEEAVEQSWATVMEEGVG